jgi:hypothetical protein
VRRKTSNGGDDGLALDTKIVMVLDRVGRFGDRPAIGTCLRQARRIISYFLLAEYMFLLHLL